MTPTVRPPNNRTLSSSGIEVLESPSLSATSASTPSSVEGDHDPLSEPFDMAEETEEPRATSDIYERGRTPVATPTQYEVDPRDMSPRRNSEELDQLGKETKAGLEQQAKNLQSGLLALLERVEKVREEHDKLDAENRFLQEYIGSLMATSKITSGGASGSNRARNHNARLR